MKAVVTAMAMSMFSAAIIEQFPGQFEDNSIRNCRLDLDIASKGNCISYYGESNVYFISQSNY